MIGYAPRAANAICSNDYPGVVSRVRQVLRVVVKYLGVHLRITNESTVNPWGTDG